MSPAAIDVDRDVEFPPFPPRPAATHLATQNQEAITWL